MKKLIFLLIALSASVAAWAQVSGTGTEGDPYVVTTWGDLKTKMAEGGYIRLDADVSDPDKTSSSYLNVPSGVTVTLNLNGHAIDRALTAATSNGYVINVAGTLTVSDSSPSTGSITGGWNSGGYGSGIYVSKAATLILNNGSITGNKNEKTRGEAKGGGVYVGLNATFTMNGGSITNNLVSTSSSIAVGGGVYVHSYNSGEGTFNMNGGVITGNSAISNGGTVYGGGVCYDNSAFLANFNLQGKCTITGNTGNDGEADNVYVNRSIHLVGPLDTETRIGVTANAGTQIVSYDGQFSNYGSIDNFTCDKTGFALELYNGIRIITVGVFVGARPSTCTESGISQDCWLKDGHYYSDQECTNEINPVTPPLGHDMTHHPALEPTATANGNVEYWECTRCGKYFLDSNGDTEISVDDILVGPTVNYIDADGQEKSVSALILTGAETYLASGWYVAIGNVSFDHKILMNSADAHVKIILADDATMSIGTSETPLNDKCIDYFSSVNVLSVYGQANGTGTLAMYSNYSALDVNTVNIHGGHVTAQGGTNSFGIRAQTALTITGGNVHATGGYTGIYSGTSGTIALHWRNASDRIYANSYKLETGGSLFIATGQYLYNGEEVISGNGIDLAKVNDKTLQPAVKITLPEGVTANGTGVFNQTDGTYALPGATVTLAAPTGYALSNVSSDEVTISETDGGYSFITPTTDVTISATIVAIPYAITLPESFEHGTVTCEQATAAVGETVTLTVTPDEGYELENLTVTIVAGESSGAPLLRRRGAERVELTPGENGIYTFEMPAAPVTVNATFKEAVITAVTDLNAAQPKTGQRYNLMGQPVGKDYKGIVIQDGKKLIVK